MNIKKWVSFTTKMANIVFKNKYKYVYTSFFQNFSKFCNNFSQTSEKRLKLYKHFNHSAQSEEKSRCEWEEYSSKVICYQNTISYCRVTHVSGLQSATPTDWTSLCVSLWTSSRPPSQHQLPLTAPAGGEEGACSSGATATGP